MSKEFIDALVIDNNLEAETAFKDTMAIKVGDALENKRRELAQDFVKTQIEVEDDPDVWRYLQNGNWEGWT